MASQHAAQRVCLFGGSFNPPHVGHTLAVTWALQTLPIDEVWWVVANEHAFGKHLRSFEERAQMVRATIQSFPHAMKLCTIEHELGGVSRTIDTVKALQQRYPNTRFSLLIGSDLVDEIDRWKNAEELKSLIDIYVIGRAEYPTENAEDLAIPNVSSSDIRKRIEAGELESCRPLIARPVFEMIEEKQWYRQ